MIALLVGATFLGTFLLIIAVWSFFLLATHKQNVDVSRGQPPRTSKTHPHARVSMDRQIGKGFEVTAAVAR